MHAVSDETIEIQTLIVDSTLPNVRMLLKTIYK